MPAKTAKAQPVRTQYTKPNFSLPTFSFDQESLVAGTNLPAPSREPSPAPAQKQGLRSTPNDPLRSHPTTPNNEAQQGNGHAGKASQNGAVAGTGAAGAASTASGAAQGYNGPVTTNTAVTAAGAEPGMKRPHHVRRLLSMRSLSQTFSSHGRTDSNVSGSDFGPPSVATGRSRTPSIFGRTSTSTWGRPESRSGFSTVGSTTDGVADGQDNRRRSLKKRMSGAFWSRRNSMTLSRLEDIGEAPGTSAGPKQPPQRQKTPPPQLPEIGKLKLGKELRGQDGGFLNGDDMFKGIEYKPEI